MDGRVTFRGARTPAVTCAPSVSLSWTFDVGSLFSRFNPWALSRAWEFCRFTGEPSKMLVYQSFRFLSLFLVVCGGFGGAFLVGDKDQLAVFSTPFFHSTPPQKKATKKVWHAPLFPPPPQPIHCTSVNISFLRAMPSPPFFLAIFCTTTRRAVPSTVGRPNTRRRVQSWGPSSNVEMNRTATVMRLFPVAQISPGQSYQNSSMVYGPSYNSCTCFIFKTGLLLSFDGSSSPPADSNQFPLFHW